MDRAACAQVVWPWRHCLCAKQMWQRGLHVTMDSSFEEMLVGRFCQGRHAIRLGSAADWKRGFDSPLGNFFSCLLSSSFREDSVLNLQTTHDLKKKNTKMKHDVLISGCMTNSRKFVMLLLYFLKKYFYIPMQSWMFLKFSFNLTKPCSSLIYFFSKGLCAYL